MASPIFGTIALILVTSSSVVNSVTNVTGKTATTPTSATPENWIINFLPNLAQMLTGLNDTRNWLAENQANGNNNPILNVLPNLLKLIDNPNNNWRSVNKGNATDNLMDTVFQNLQKFLKNNTDFNGWLSNNATKQLLGFVSNMDIPKFVGDMLSNFGTIGKANPVTDVLGMLLKNGTLPNWFKAILTSNPSFYQTISKIFSQQNNGGMGAIMTLVSPILKSYSDQMMASLSSGLQEMNISSRCADHSVKVLSGMLSGQMWALQYLDAIGKPKSGLLEGSFFWPGSFHECLNVVAPATEESFKGNYCMVNVPIPTAFLAALAKAASEGGNAPAPNGLQAGLAAAFLSMKYGVCIPNSCSTEDVGIMVNDGLMKRLPESWYGNNTPVVKPVCHTEQDFPNDTRAVIVVCVLAGIGFILLLGTLYDVITLLLWQHRQSSAKCGETKSKNVKLAEVVANGNGHIQMSDDEDGHIKEKPVEVFINNAFESENEVEKETEVESNGDCHKPEVTSNGVSHMAAEKQKEAESFEEKTRPKPGFLGSLLMAFSLYTNTKKLMSTETRAGSLGAIHGARFFSMTWVLLGHTYIFHISIANNLGGYSKDFTERWTSLAITNALVSVDSFFTLSGLLVSYLTLKEMAKVKSAKINWFMFYFHRFWRLTPPYMLVLMVYVTLFQYFGNGPMWQPGQVEPVTCNSHWWKNLIYINNFEMADSCMGHTWYLANDMQFYVISPLILIPLFYSKIIGLTILALFFLATFITTGVISYVNEFRPFDARPEFMDKMYVKPWCRIGPYLVGLLVGYLLFKTKCKVKFHKSTVLLGWCSAAVISLATLYGVYGESHGYPMSNEASAVYNALHRTAWGVGLGWVLFACITGYGGIINTFLSWKAFIPLARLTYMTYLVHLYIMYYFNNTSQGPIYITDITISYIFVGNLFFTYCISFLISLSFEAPFVGLERVIFRRK